MVSSLVVFLHTISDAGSFVRGAHCVSAPHVSTVPDANKAHRARLGVPVQHECVGDFNRVLFGENGVDQGESQVDWSVQKLGEHQAAGFNGCDVFTAPGT